MSEAWEPVTFNEEGTRLRKMPAFSDLNDRLLFVVTGLKWLHGIKPDFHFQSVFVGPPSKVQTMALNLLAGEVSQFFHQCGGVMKEVDWDQKLQARTVGYDGAEVYTAECLDLKRICDALPPAGLGGLVNAADEGGSVGSEPRAEVQPLELDRPKDPMIWASNEDWWIETFVSSFSSTRKPR